MRKIKIEIEMVNSCFGLTAKFWKGNSMEGQTDLKHVLDEMFRIEKYYKDTCGMDTVFVPMKGEE